MALPFSRSLRSLESDRFRLTAVGLGVAVLLLGMWLLWFFLARIGIWKVSESARLEVEKAVHPVEAPVNGRVLRSYLVLDRHVEPGDLLVELEAADQELRLQEERSRLAALSAQLASVRNEIEVNRQALRRSRETGLLSFEEARAQLREAEAAAAFAVEDMKRTQLLFDQGLQSEVDLLKAKSEVEKTRAVVERSRIAIRRLEEQWGTEEEDRRKEIEGLQRVVGELEGSIAQTRAIVERLEHDVAKRLIRAQVEGRLGEVGDLQAGSFVEEGDQLCAIVPTGAPRVVAEFRPHDALGRIKPGQRAELRLEGFPWIQYGTVGATVTRVASETRRGTVRVELAVRPEPASAIPLDHGLPGQVEIEVEKVSPASLLLRIVGKVVTDRSGPAPIPVPSV